MRATGKCHTRISNRYFQVLRKAFRTYRVVTTLRHSHGCGIGVQTNDKVNWICDYFLIRPISKDIAWPGSSLKSGVVGEDSLALVTVTVTVVLAVGMAAALESAGRDTDKVEAALKLESSMVTTEATSVDGVSCC